MKVYLVSLPPPPPVLCRCVRGVSTAPLLGTRDASSRTRRKPDVCVVHVCVRARAPRIQLFRFYFRSTTSRTDVDHFRRRAAALTRSTPEGVNPTVSDGQLLMLQRERAPRHRTLLANGRHSGERSTQGRMDEFITEHTHTIQVAKLTAEQITVFPGGGGVIARVT
jgi:hypothetical protein